MSLSYKTCLGQGIKNRYLTYFVRLYENVLILPTQQNLCLHKGALLHSRNLMTWNSDLFLPGAVIPFPFLHFLDTSSFQDSQLNKTVSSNSSQWREKRNNHLICCDWLISVTEKGEAQAMCVSVKLTTMGELKKRFLINIIAI